MSVSPVFQSQIADNDGVLDGPGMFGEEAGRLSACLAAVYRITATLLSWPGLADDDNRQLATGGSHSVMSIGNQKFGKPRKYQ